MALKFSIENILKIPTSNQDNTKLLLFPIKQPIFMDYSTTTSALNDDSFEELPNIFLNKKLNKKLKTTEIFNCEICDKTFSAYYNLQRHMPIHTGARPFSCKVK